MTMGSLKRGDSLVLISRSIVLAIGRLDDREDYDEACFSVISMAEGNPK
jgi:hypothetical protein